MLVFSGPLAFKQTSLGWGRGAFALPCQVRGLDPFGSDLLGDARSRGPSRMSPGRAVTVACQWRQWRGRVVSQDFRGLLTNPSGICWESKGVWVVRTWGLPVCLVVAGESSAPRTCCEDLLAFEKPRCGLTHRWMSMGLFGDAESTHRKGPLHLSWNGIFGIPLPFLQGYCRVPKER